MAKRPEQMKLGAFLYPTGHHVAAWRHPDSSEMVTLDDFAKLARLAEDAKLDYLFLADMLSVRLSDPEAASRRAHTGIAPFEPITLLSALAGMTRNIGLLATASTSFNEPYNVARSLQSLNLLSDGRAGWNLVTSSDPEAAFNYGLEQHALHQDRYERAEEFIDVVTGLWDSWYADAFPRDKENGVYFDPAKMHVLNHVGKHFRVKGPLNLPPSRHGRPLVVQAGGSEPGRNLAARTADLVFAALDDMQSAIDFCSDMRARLVRFGRREDSLKVMPGVMVVVGSHRSEAQAKLEQLQELIQPEVGLDLLSSLLGADLSGHPVDGPIPELPESNKGKTRQKVILDKARRDNLSIRQLYQHISGGRGHMQVVGTVAQIADQLQERFEAHAADGFNLMAPIFPGGLVDIVEGVVPELQRRGLFRTEYEGATLRQNIGLGNEAHRTE